MYASTGFTPAARIRTSTSPAPGFGSGTSSSFNTSGPPNSRTTIAFIFHSALGPLYRLRQEPFTLRMTKGLVVAVENRSVVFQGAVGAFLASTAPAASTATTIDQ